MPRWLLRLLYTFRGKRRVRLHITTGPGLPDADGADLTIEGLELGVWAGFHVLVLARTLDTEESSTELSGKTVEIPRERVIFRQVLAQMGHSPIAPYRPPSPLSTLRRAYIEGRIEIEEFEQRLPAALMAPPTRPSRNTGKRALA